MIKKLSYALAILAIFQAQISAAKENLPPMPSFQAWSGPYGGTRIVKYMDYEEGVACYVYVSEEIGSSQNCNKSGCSTHFKGDIGDISCVKIRNNQSKN